MCGRAGTPHVGSDCPWLQACRTAEPHDEPMGVAPQSLQEAQEAFAAQIGYPQRRPGDTQPPSGPQPAPPLNLQWPPFPDGPDFPG